MKKAMSLLIVNREENQSQELYLCEDLEILRQLYRNFTSYELSANGQQENECESGKVEVIIDSVELFDNIAAGKPVYVAFGDESQSAREAYAAKDKGTLDQRFGAGSAKIAEYVCGPLIKLSSLSPYLQEIVYECNQSENHMWFVEPDNEDYLRRKQEDPNFSNNLEKEVTKLGLDDTIRFDEDDCEITVYGGVDFTIDLYA